MTSYQNNTHDDTEMIELMEGEAEWRTVLVQEIVGFTSARKGPDGLFRVSVTLLTANKEKIPIIAKFHEQSQADLYYDRLKDVTNTISARAWMAGVGRGAAPVSHTEIATVKNN